MTKEFGSKKAFKFVSSCFKFVSEVDGREGLERETGPRGANAKTQKLVGAFINEASSIL